MNENVFFFLLKINKIFYGMFLIEYVIFFCNDLLKILDKRDYKMYYLFF